MDLQEGPPVGLMVPHSPACVVDFLSEQKHPQTGEQETGRKQTETVMETLIW